MSLVNVRSAFCATCRAHRARDGARCQSMGEGTVHVCTDSGFFVDGHIINSEFFVEGLLIACGCSCEVLGIGQCDIAVHLLLVVLC